MVTRMNEHTRKKLEQNIGIPLDVLCEMDFNGEVMFIEKNWKGIKVF